MGKDRRIGGSRGIGVGQHPASPAAVWPWLPSSGAPIEKLRLNQRPPLQVQARGRRNLQALALLERSHSHKGGKPLPCLEHILE